MDVSVKNLRQMHQEGKASIFRTGTAPDDPAAAVYVIVTPQFDPATGGRLKDQWIGVERAEMVARRDELQAELDELDLLLADLEPLAPEEVLKRKS